MNLLLNEYNHFYKKFYGIDRNHQEAVNTISKFSSIFNKDSFILEYGCATGFNLRFLKRLGFKNLYGVDAFKDYVNIAKAIDNDIQYEYLNFVHDSIDKKFDYIFTRGVLQQGKTQKEEIKNTDDEVSIVISKFFDSLNKNGQVIISEGPVRNWVHLFEQNNFKLVSNIKDIFLFKK